MGCVMGCAMGCGICMGVYTQCCCLCTYTHTPTHSVTATPVATTTTTNSMATNTTTNTTPSSLYGGGLQLFLRVSGHNGRTFVTQATNDAVFVARDWYVCEWVCFCTTSVLSPSFLVPYISFIILLLYISQQPPSLPPPPTPTPPQPHTTQHTHCTPKHHPTSSPT